jgi:hypothetical protein
MLQENQKQLEPKMAVVNIHSLATAQKNWFQFFFQPDPQ